MTEQIPLSQLYRGARERITDLVAANQDSHTLPVPATPGWRVHDVVAHLAGAAEDVTHGWSPAGGPTEEWTATHVARGKDIPTGKLLEKWTALGPDVERVIDDRKIGPLVIDAGTHEHDIRGAFGDTAARDSDVVTVGTAILLKALQVPASLLVRTEDREVRVGPETDDGLVTLRTTTFEAFRWRLGRRSRAQLAAMDWTGDPEPFLDHLYIFGPAESDLIE